MGLKIAAGLTLDNGLRPQAIAGVAPTLDYRFARDKREIEAVSLTDKLTYTGGNGTFVGSDGYIQRATTNVPRFDHDPVSRISEGLLVEGSRTNLLLRSEEFDSANWTLVNIAAFGSGSVANAIEGPSGTVTADLILDNPNNDQHYVRQTAAVAASTTYTFSAFLKKESNSYGTVSIVGGASGWNDVLTIDLDTGASQVPSGSFGSTSVTAFSNGWYRVSVTKITTGSGFPQFRIGTALNLTTVGYAGSGSGIYLWGAQLEQASTPSTYIPTTSATVTRTADSAVIDGTGVLTGTYTMVAKPEGSALVSGSTIVLQEGYTTERVMVFPTTLTAQQITDIREAM